MTDKGTIIKEACLAIKYLVCAGSLANTRYMRIVKDAKAVAISIAKEILNKLFIMSLSLIRLRNYLPEDR